MRLWVLSDLHLEAVRFPEAFAPSVEFDVLVAAGDVWQGDSEAALRTVARLAGGKPAVFVLGNHEFWDREVAQERRVARRAAARHGVTLLDTGAARIDGVRFVGGTLWQGDWADPAAPTGEPIRMERRGRERPITGAEQAMLHRRCRRALEYAIEATPICLATIVAVTHHPPPPALTAPPVALWVHGHLHQSIDIIRPGGTRVVCNPAGPGFSNPTFREDLVITV